MKALLLSFSFLLLFSIVVFSSRKACTEFVYDSFLYLKKEQLHTQFHSNMQRKFFQSAHRKAPAAKEHSLELSEPTKRAPRARVKFGRDYEMSKINLSFLGDEELYPETKELLATILMHLYGPSSHRPALISNLEVAHGLIEELVEVIQEAGPNDRFRDLKLKRNKALFYSLIQGTKKFDLETGLGVVPFEDLFILHAATPKTVLFCKEASLTSIDLLFSKEFAAKVVQEEKQLHEQNKSRLSAGEWKSLIQNSVDADIKEEALDWVNFTSKGPRGAKAVSVDEGTGLKMEGPLMGMEQEEIE